MNVRPLILFWFLIFATTVALPYGKDDDDDGGGRQAANSSNAAAGGAGDDGSGGGGDGNGGGGGDAGSAADRCTDLPDMTSQADCTRNRSLTWNAQTNAAVDALLSAGVQQPTKAGDPPAKGAVP